MLKLTKVYNGKNWNIVEIETTRELENFLSAPILDGRDNASETGSKSFTGTASFEQADNLRRKGDKKSLSMLNEYKIKFDKYIQYNNGYKIKQRNDIHGFVPIVPNAIIGLPLSMINQTREAKKVKGIDILYNVSIRCGTGTDDIARKGAIMLSLIDALERKGFRVNLKVGSVCMKGNTVHGVITTMKRYDEPLNIRKLAYYLVNPSCLRRTFFKLKETISELTNVTNNGYGTNNKFDKQREKLKAIYGEQLRIVDSSIMQNTDISDDELFEKMCQVLGVESVTVLS